MYGKIIYNDILKVESVMKNEYLEGAKVATAHGVRGILKLEHLCDSPRVLAGVKRVFLKKHEGFEGRLVRSASVMGNSVIMRIEGIDSREAAIAMRGVILYLHRSDVPIAEGAMFIADMIGLPVIHADTGERLGTLSDISDAAGRRIYTVRTERGEVLLPDIPEFIKEISEERGMRVRPIPGFFDEADEV